MTAVFPFSAVVGQEALKRALMLVAIDPGIGGVLIAGDRGTAKSTVARGIAALLPTAPNGEPAPFVELPLGATEDRVIGSLDIAKVLKEGSTELRSGLLARAHHGVLYVDEVNLLPDHLVDLLLDAAASGWLTVERDGVSYRAAARFMLIGTMNPEEGELRPQFLDRFGLCVQVRGLDTQDVRVAAIRQRLAFDADAPGVLTGAREPERVLRSAILTARTRLAALAIHDSHLSAVAALAIEHGLAGIRGDLALVKAARALAAWEGAPDILEDHLRRVTDLAFGHRIPRRRATGGARGSPGGKPVKSVPEEDGRAASTAASTAAGTPHDAPGQDAAAAPAPGLRMVTDAVDREQPGRRGTQGIAARRIVGAEPFSKTGTLAITETLTAAVGRGARLAAAGVELDPADLRQHRRRGPGTSHVVFLVDASGSMAAQRRLSLAKGAALGLLAASHRRRDEVALMIFRGEGTDLVLPFTRHVASIERALSEVPTGGRTPLAAAFHDAARLMQTREAVLLVLFTDGRANVAVDGGDPWDEAQQACSLVRAAAAAALVIDCEAGPITLGRARSLAAKLGAECISLDSLDTADLTLCIHRRLDAL